MGNHIGVLEIGGTHVTAATVRLGAAAAIDARVRRPVTADGSAAVIVAELVSAAHELGPVDGPWGIAVPGPFDYEAGIGRFSDVAKFDALHGVDLGALLADGLPSRRVRFLNDAVAFGIGEGIIGAAAGHRRALCITLGTGVGSCFLADGRPVAAGPEVPPGGEVHLLDIDGAPLEDTMSRRALLRAWRAASGGDADVREIAERARAGDARAGAVFAHAYGKLAGALTPWLARFGADVLVVGGSIATSWDLVRDHLAPAFAAHGLPGIAVVPAAHPDDSPLIGAASWALGDPDARPVARTDAAP